MKNQVLPPRATTARPVPAAIEYVLYVYCTLYAVQLAPAIGVEAALERSVMRFFSAAIGITASAVELVGISTTASTWSSSNHLRAMLAAMSALFWWSALMITIGLPRTLPPKSSAAICAAMTDPGPARSEYAPVMSVSTATLTT